MRMARQHPRYGEVVRVGDYMVESYYLRFIADSLRRLPQKRRELRDLEEGVIRATPVEDLTGMPRAPETVGNPTLAAAHKLMDEHEPTFGRRAHLRLWLHSVDEIYRKLTTDQQQVIKLLYWDKSVTVLGAGERLNVSVPTAYRLRNHALLAFATELIGDHILMPVVERDKKRQ